MLGGYHHFGQITDFTYATDQILQVLKGIQNTLFYNFPAKAAVPAEDRTAGYVQISPPRNRGEGLRMGSPHGPAQNLDLIESRRQQQGFGAVAEDILCAGISGGGFKGVQHAEGNGDNVFCRRRRLDSPDIKGRKNQKPAAL